MQKSVNQTTSTNLNWWKWKTKPPSASRYHDWDYRFKRNAKARYYFPFHADAERALFASTLIHLTPRITSSSVVHDNGTGAGAATSVILDMLDPKFLDEIPEILITDTSKLNVANECYSQWSPRITAVKADSQDSSSIPDGKLTHSIAMFTMFHFPDAPQSLREIYRTLQPGGVAVLLAWKRSGSCSVIHQAQSLVRPDLPLEIFSSLDFSGESVLFRFVVEAGFSEAKVEVRQERTVRKAEHIEEMKKLILWDGFRDAMTKGWTDEEKGKWPAAVEEAIQKDVEQYGGVLFEAWTATAYKEAK